MQFTELETQITALAEKSISLEPTRTERSDWQASANILINEFVEGLAEQQAFSSAQAITTHDFDKAVAQSCSPEELFAIVQKSISQSGILTAGPGFLGFIPGGGLYIAAVADHLAAALNSYSADAFAAPISSHIHNEALKWLLNLIGYDDAAWGDITSGGSQATLTAFCVAREACGIKPRDYSNTCVYVGEHTHHCCKKALDILFAGDIQIRKVPSINHAIDYEYLARQIENDIANGLKPWLVVATLGSTNLGRVDSIADIATIAKKYHLWMHVDAAYGGFFKLCPEAAALFSKLEDADSVVLDPHKGMFLPYGCGAVLFKKGEHLRQTFSGGASYLQDRDHETHQIHSPMDYSIELTRPFRSLRIWLTIKVHGSKILASALSEKLLLARYAYERIAVIKNIVMLAKPDLSIFAFRYQPVTYNKIDADSCTKELLRRINLHKEVFLTSTMIDNYFVIRVAILSHRTHLVTLNALVKIITEESANLSMQNGNSLK